MKGKYDIISTRLQDIDAQAESTWINGRINNMDLDWISLDPLIILLSDSPQRRQLAAAPTTQIPNRPLSTNPLGAAGSGERRGLRGLVQFGSFGYSVVWRGFSSPRYERTTV